MFLTSGRLYDYTACGRSSDPAGICEGTVAPSANLELCDFSLFYTALKIFFEQTAVL